MDVVKCAILNVDLFAQSIRSERYSGGRKTALFHFFLYFIHSRLTASLCIASQLFNSDVRWLQTVD